MAFPVKTPEYQHLAELKEPMSVVYGPVNSRRLGSSLGINLLGSQKICSFDCPYCDLGLTTLRMNQLKDESLYPTVAEIEAKVRSALRLIHDREETLNHLTVSGNGEPTLHPQFAECIEALVKVRSDFNTNLKLVVLTNGAHCDNKRVIQGLNLADERMVKLDAGNDQVLKSVNRPLVRGSISKITSGVRKLKDVIIQSMFVQGAVDNTRAEDIDEWLEVAGIIKPKLIHISTLNKVPAIGGLRAVDEDTLYTIASKIKRKLQIETVVF